MGTTRNNEIITVAGTRDAYTASAEVAAQEETKLNNESEGGSGVPDSTSESSSESVCDVEEIRRERAGSQARYNALLEELHSRLGPPNLPEEASSTGHVYVSGLVGVASNRWLGDDDDSEVEKMKADSGVATRKLRGANATV